MNTIMLVLVATLSFISCGTENMVDMSKTKTTVGRGDDTGGFCLLCSPVIPSNYDSIRDFDFKSANRGEPVAVGEPILKNSDKYIELFIGDGFVGGSVKLDIKEGLMASRETTDVVYENHKIQEVQLGAERLAALNDFLNKVTRVANGSTPKIYALAYLRIAHADNSVTSYGTYLSQAEIDQKSIKKLFEIIYSPDQK